jgi:hypothetical protein
MLRAWWITAGVAAGQAVALAAEFKAGDPEATHGMLVSVLG